MAAQKSQSEFRFVHSTLDFPSGSKDHANRSLIRRQAMRKTASTRHEHGNYGKHNLRQYPLFLFNEVTCPRQSGTEHSALMDVARINRNGPMPNACNDAHDHQSDVLDEAIWLQTSENVKGASAHGAEGLRLSRPTNEGSSGSLASSWFPAINCWLSLPRTTMNLSDLSFFTSIHINRAVKRALPPSPSQLVYQLQPRKGISYLNYLADLQEDGKCVQDAMSCVTARVKRIVSPDQTREADVITAYVKALRGLQKALDSPEQRCKPEILCATEILTLYELLNPLEDAGWIRHIAGVAKLIQVRGPKGYNTDFEKSLFMAHLGSIITECLLNGQRCFLAQDAWQGTFRTLISPTAHSLDDDSEMTVRLAMLKAFVPNFFADVTFIVCPPTCGSPDAAFVRMTASRLRDHRAKMLHWNKDYQAMLMLMPGMDSSCLENHYKIYATYLSCMMILSRLLAAIVSMDERMELEAHAQDTADQMIRLDDEARRSSEQTGPFLSISLGIAKTIKETGSEWATDQAWDPDTEELQRERQMGTDPVSVLNIGTEEVTHFIPMWKFRKWALGLGRTMP